MFSSKKTSSSGNKKPRRSDHTRDAFVNNLIPGNNFGDDSDDNDEDLEAELQKLMYGGSKAVKKPPKKTAVPQENIDSMVAACMEEIASDEEFDEEDPALLDELAQFEDEDQDFETAPAVQVQQPPVQSNRVMPIQPIQTQPSSTSGYSNTESAGQSLLVLLDSRIEMYTKAEKNAKANGEASRARRFARGLSTLTDLRKKLKSGKGINEEDIPPAIAINISSSTTQVKTPKEEEKLTDVSAIDTQPPPPVDSGTIHPTVQEPIKTAKSEHVVENVNPITKLIMEKRNIYKEQALNAKKEGNLDQAKQNLVAVKKCDELIDRARNGEQVDLSFLSSSEVPTTTLPSKTLERTISRDQPIAIPENPEDIPPPDHATFGAPPPPTSIDEALQQRLNKYRQDEAKAKEEGNSSRMRRLGRICKQYEDAIKIYKKGGPTKLAGLISELPSPPGFSPIPMQQPETSSTTATAPSLAQQNTPNVPQLDQKGHSPNSAVQTASAVPKKHMSLQEKELALLVKRQAEFKAAALKAKKSGQIEQAKEYLRQAKGFDSLIEASKGGLPVNFKTLPVLPTKDVAMDFEIVSTEDCGAVPNDLSGASRTEMYVKLEKDLLEQIKMCQANRIYFKSTGDVPSTNKFHQMEEHTKKDLDSLRNSFKRGDSVPKFHYEVRSFSKVVLCPELTDNELEFMVVQGINLNVAKDAHTYCRLEFPYPKETPFKDKSAVVKETNANITEYNHSVKVPLNIKDKTCQRVFKRQSAKVEVWNKVGFLRSDTCLGSVQVKLQPLESQCVLHDTFALMDGRKAVGGQLEIKIRIRNPMVTKQIEKVEEKWLVISF